MSALRSSFARRHIKIAANNGIQSKGGIRNLRHGTYSKFLGFRHKFFAFR
jgi:hypothetical protein